MNDVLNRMTYDLFDGFAKQCGPAQRQQAANKKRTYVQSTTSGVLPGSYSSIAISQIHDSRKKRREAQNANEEHQSQQAIGGKQTTENRAKNCPANKDSTDQRIKEKKARSKRQPESQYYDLKRTE